MRSIACSMALSLPLGSARLLAAAGLRFSTLGTDSYRVAHRLYRKLGYEDVWSASVALGRADALPRPPGLRAEPAGPERLAVADSLFEQAAHGWLGFARRHTPFFPFLHARSYLSAQDVWLLWRGEEAVGYAVASADDGLLRVRNLLLAKGVDAPAAAASLAQATDARTIQARLDDASHVASCGRAGFQVAGPSWGTFMVKPLAADATIAEFRRRYGLDDGRFLVSSYMDLT
jgi:hypothetical protein